MAQLETFETGEHGPYAPWWKMHRGHTRSWPHEEDDWTRMELSSSRPSPRHRWDEIHRPAYSAYSAAPSSVATSRQRPAVTRAATLLLSSPSGMRHHSSDTPLIGRPPAVPSFPRASTAPIGKAAFENYDPRAHPGISRASLHRDLSPRSAAPYFRSTPDSRRSMRSSLSESDNDTDLTRPTPEEDDKDEEDEDGRAADTIFVDKKALRDRMDIRKRPSQEYPTASSMKQHSARQSQNQKQKQRGRVRGDDLDLHEEGDEVAVAQQETQGFPQRSQQKRGHHGHRSRRSSGSRGAGGGSSSRGRRHESVIPEEATEDQQADADAEMDNDDFDDDRRRRRTPSRHTRRSASRNTTATHDVRRDLSRSKSRLRHADSDEFNPRASSRRPTKRYCKSEFPDQYANGPAHLRRAQTHPTAPSHVTAPPSIDSSKKAPSLFESPLGFGNHALPADKSSKRNHCLECMDEFPLSRLAKLSCGHRMCATCLKKKFKASISDKRLMPPRCCTMDAIALKHVEKLFDTGFKLAWNHKFREVSVERRIYCPSPSCGQWIKDENLFRGEDGRQTAVCGRCRTSVCCLCNNKAHASRDCPRDERTIRFLAKVEGRQTCNRCKSEVELEEGQNHMICQCGAESCMICGAKWGHCDCQVFDVETDRAGYGHLPYPPTNGSRYDRFGSAPAIATRDFRPSNSGGSRPYSAGEGMRSRPQSSYEDKSRARSYRDDYRADTHRDNDLARRMEAFGGLGDDDDTMDAFSSAIKKARLDRYARRHANDDAGAPVHRRRSFMEDKDYDRDENDDRDYSARAAADILPSAPHPPPAPPTPPQQQAQAQAQSAQHRYQHQQLQQTHPPPPPHPPYPSLQQHQPLHPIHPQHDRFELHEQLEHQRAPPPPSQYPTTTYDRPAASMDFYTSGPSRTRAVTTDSEVGRLANRFNTESRSGPMHRPKAPPALTGPPMATGVSHGVPMGAGGGMGVMPMGPMSPNGPMAPLPPMMPMQGPPPPLMPPPLMGSMPIMSMAPIPHPSIMPEIPMMRRHLMEEDMFMGHEPLQRGGSFEQVPFSSYPVEDEYAFSSGAGGRRHRRRDEDASHAQEARRSEMAGLAGPGRGMDRVADWMEFVGNEPPGKDSDSVLNP